jgi:hypothetical protein
MSVTALVVDTSYLLELLKVPGRFDPAFSERVKQKFREAVAAGHRLYVPFPVIFELANHIALVRDGGGTQAARGLAGEDRSELYRNSHPVDHHASLRGHLVRLEQVVEAV